MDHPLLSVCVITYNHEKFIREAIDGVLMQKVDFTWELIIADDFSTDGTREILLEYKKKYPDFIRLILQRENVGATQNWIQLITTPKSKYIAYFDGDDYWTDPLKLQKQVDFLESNPQASGCFHDCITVDQNGETIEDYYKGRQYQEHYTQQECLTNLCSSYGTASLMFRSSVLANGLPSYFLKAGCDFLLDLVITEHGTLNYLPFKSSAYRIHSKGIWQGVNRSENYLSMLRRLELLMQDPIMASQYTDELSGMVEHNLRLYWQSLKDEGIDRISRFRKCVLVPKALTFLNRLSLFRYWEKISFRKIPQSLLGGVTRHFISTSTQHPSVYINPSKHESGVKENG